MAPHSSTFAWKIPWTEEPGRLQSMGSQRVGYDWATSLSLFTFMHWRREMTIHSSVLAWRIPGTGKPGGLPSMGSHRVGHDWSDLAAAAAAAANVLGIYPLLSFFLTSTLFWVTIMFLLWIPICLPAGLHTATFPFLQLLFSPQPKPSFESFDIMHLIMPLLCLKSFSGFSVLWGLNKKQTFLISYKARQTALISFHHSAL